VSLRRFVINTSAMSSVNVLRLLAQFFAVPILSRLLSPADYGVVGMAMPFMLFAMMIADAGVGMSLVLLRQILRRLCLVDRLQQGHRERRCASAIMSRRRVVAIEFVM
jgi:Polysaccharide biosynthesis protein